MWVVCFVLLVVVCVFMLLLVDSVSLVCIGITRLLGLLLWLGLCELVVGVVGFVVLVVVVRLGVSILIFFIMCCWLFVW